jgi:hypothetical protein
MAADSDASFPYSSVKIGLGYAAKFLRSRLGSIGGPLCFTSKE